MKQLHLGLNIPAGGKNLYHHRSAGFRSADHVPERLEQLTAHADAKISLIALKTQLLHFRDKADTWDIATYRAYLLKILTDITYFPEKLSFHFSGLPWPIEMIMPPP